MFFLHIYLNVQNRIGDNLFVMFFRNRLMGGIDNPGIYCNDEWSADVDD
jgi:hypothetical protein